MRAFSTELFPTSYRGTSAAWLSLVQTLGWALGLALVSLVGGEIATSTSWIAMVVLVAAFALLTLPETYRQELEAISHDRGRARRRRRRSLRSPRDRPPRLLRDALGRELRVLPGHPLPFGVTETRRGLNFAVFSKHATAVTLVLFGRRRDAPVLELPLDPDTQPHRPRVARRDRRPRSRHALRLARGARSAATRPSIATIPTPC